MANDWTKQAIVVRKRTVEETRNLTLLVIGKEFINLAFYYGTLALPIFALDLVGLYFVGRALELEPYGNFASLFFYCLFTIALIRIESAFVGSTTTQFLGLWLFRGGEKIARRDVFAAWLYRLPQLIYFLVLTRIIRRRAFYLETILLERTPFFKTKDKISTGARVVAIDRSAGIELLSDSITTTFFWFLGIISGYFLLDKFGSFFITETSLWFPIYHLFVFPFFVFAAQLFLVVYHFFQYVNIRVKREGWDVNLTFKAERMKLNSEANRQTAYAGERLAQRGLRTLTLDSEIFGDKPEPSNNKTTPDKTETQK